MGSGIVSTTCIWPLIVRVVIGIPVLIIHVGTHVCKTVHETALKRKALGTRECNIGTEKTAGEMKRVESWAVGKQLLDGWGHRRDQEEGELRCCFFFGLTSSYYSASSRNFRIQREQCR